MQFIAKEISPDTYVNIMVQYYPAHKSYEFKELNRGISLNKYKMAVESAKLTGLKNYKSSI